VSLKKNHLGKVRYLDTSGPSMARRSTRPWERRHLLSTDGVSVVRHRSWFGALQRCIS